MRQKPKQVSHYAYATLTMAPKDSFRLTTRNKTDAAEAVASELGVVPLMILILRGVWSRSEPCRFLFWDCARADYRAWLCWSYVTRQLFPHLLESNFQIILMMTDAFKASVHAVRLQ